MHDLVCSSAMRFTGRKGHAIREGDITVTCVNRVYDVASVDVSAAGQRAEIRALFANGSYHATNSPPAFQINF